MPSSPQSIIIDTDISLGEFGRDVDDGLAIIMALNSPELDLVGITKTYGNAPLSNVHRSLDRLLTIWMRSKNQALRFKNINGADRPLHQLSKDLRFFLTHMINDSGYMKIELPSNISSKLQKIKRGEIFPAVRFFADYCQEHPKDTTIVCLGPLTNLALACLIFPDLGDQIQKLSIMGGAIKRQWGYEFNFANDPLATNIIFNLPLRQHIASLEVCHAQQFTIKEYQILGAHQTRLSHFLQHQIYSWLILNRTMHGAKLQSGFYPFDPCALANLIDPSIIRYTPLWVKHTLPRWVWDFRNPTLKTLSVSGNSQKRKYPIEWGIKIDSGRFMDLLISRLY